MKYLQVMLKLINNERECNHTISLFPTCYVHNYLIITPPSTRPLLAENCWRSLYAGLRVAPISLRLSNMTVKTLEEKMTT